MSAFKKTLAAATVLLLAGGGCPTARVEQGTEAEVSGEAAIEQEQGKMKGEGDEVDVAVDAYLEGSASAEAEAGEESADVDALTSTDAELDAYGEVYDKNEF